MTGNIIKEISGSGTFDTSTGVIISTHNMHPYFEYLWEIITLEFMLKFFVVYFFALWISLILWVARDVSNRSTSRIFQSFCVFMMVILSPLGVFMYLLIRPRKTVFEKYFEEIENNLSILGEIVEERLEHSKHPLSCSSCEAHIESDYIICPACHHSLKHSCHHCKKEIRESWNVCPYCQTKQEKKKEKKKKKTD